MQPLEKKPPLIIIGPSASGKSTVAKILVDSGVISVIPTWTTRPRREEEFAGYTDHRFVTEEEFSEMQHSGGFVKTAQLFGLPYRYGLPDLLSVSCTSPVPVVMLRSLLANEISQIFGKSPIYQIEASLNKITERLSYRGKKSDMGTRATGYWNELTKGRKIADRIFINDGAPEELASSIADCIRKDFLQQPNLGP